MKKDNFFKRSARWVARMFGYKAENKFARVVWYVFATSAAIVTLYVAVALTIEIIDEVGDIRTNNRRRRITSSPTYLHENHNRYVSPYVIYHDGYPSYLYNTTLGRRTVTGIQWICKSSDGDSLAVFCTNDEHKRGYFNRFTGEAVIPAQYEKVWIFSEGVACVYDQGMLHFIDHQGQTLMGKEFLYSDRIDDYCFHNGLCSVLGDGNRIGLIDKQGNWVVDPIYYEMSYNESGFWYTRDREWNWGLLNTKGEELLPVEYDAINIDRENGCIIVRRLDHINQVLDFNCNVINSCNYVEVEKIEYVTDRYDEYGNLKSAVANCQKYRTLEWYYGLMDMEGNIVTPPFYSDITAIGPDRYHCEGPYGSVILDSKGREVGEKL